jgi:hypothetical protein
MPDKKIVCTTGSTIDSYLDWVRKELTKKNYGEVSIVFTVTRGCVTDVKKNSMDSEHIPLPPKEPC